MTPWRGSTLRVAPGRYSPTHSVFQLLRAPAIPGQEFDQAINLIWIGRDKKFVRADGWSTVCAHASVPEDFHGASILPQLTESGLSPTR